MANPRKAQGTANETSVVEWAMTHPRVKSAYRLAEGGSNDPGDIAIETIGGDTYVIEAKWRERLNIHKALEAHIRKVERADHPFVVAGTALQWKRTVLKDGNERRSAEGIPQLFCVTADEWLDLITRS